jgi:hypothetical protein
VVSLYHIRYGLTRYVLGRKVKGQEEEADGSTSFLFFPRLVRNGAGFTGGCWGCSFPAGVAVEDIIV